MAFCTKCGFDLGDGVKFCPNCGQSTNATTGYNAPPQYVQVVKPIIPGRGFGITSMVLGIIGLFYAFIVSVSGTANFVAIITEEEYMSFAVAVAFAVYAVFFSVLSILAWVFATVSRKKGYINGVSKSGLVMGVIGVCGFALPVVLCVVALCV